MLGRKSLKVCLAAGAIMLALASWRTWAQPAGFEEWVEEVRAEAARRGLTSPAVVDAMAGMWHVDRVLELDRRQPELIYTFWRYIDARITADRLAQGQAYLVAYEPLLNEVYYRYGIQPRVLVALWGLESDYGRLQGDFPVIPALATLAFDSRRSRFFRQQLFAALELIDRGDLVSDVRGSWAGAIGQPQFIPTTIQGYAVDFDADGRRDLQHSLSDVFASAANYLSASGWSSGSSWGHEVRLPQGFDYMESGLDVEKPLSEWQRLGVRHVDGSDLSKTDLSGSLLLPAGAAGPAFLVYHNFRAILRWNNSVLYALAVGHLSDRLAGTGPLAAERPLEDVSLSRYDVVELQSRLSELGFEPGESDGIVGERTQRAIRRFQKSVNLPADGYPDPQLLQQLRVQVAP